MWYESKVKFEQVQEDGCTKMVTESYMVDALTFTDAEALTMKWVAQYVSGELDVVALKRTNIKEVRYNAEGDKWYNCKLVFITLDEKSGKEKKTNYNVLVQASSTEEGTKQVELLMQGSMQDWELKSITETNIMDVYAHGGATQA